MKQTKNNNINSKNSLVTSEKTKALLFSVKETTQRINAVLSPTIFSKQPTYVVVVR